MKKPKRNILEIHMDVLNAIINGTTRPTRIAAIANITYPKVNAILTNMLSKGLVTRQINGTYFSYEITIKGKQTLQKYKELLKEI